MSDYDQTLREFRARRAHKRRPAKPVYYVELHQDENVFWIPIRLQLVAGPQEMLARAMMKGVDWLCCVAHDAYTNWGQDRLATIIKGLDE